MMKKYAIISCILLAGCSSSSTYSRSIDDLEARLATLEATVQELQDERSHTVERIETVEMLLTREDALQHVGNAGQTYSLSGMLERLDPPAPDDIGYEYALRLDRPVLDPNQASGNPITYRYVAVPAQDSNVDLSTHVGERVTIEGEIIWGYAESRVLSAQSVSAR